MRATPFCAAKNEWLKGMLQWKVRPRMHLNNISFGY